MILEILFVNIFYLIRLSVMIWASGSQFTFLLSLTWTSWPILADRTVVSGDVRCEEGVDD